MRFGQALHGDGVLRMWDATGRVVRTVSVATGAFIIDVDCVGLSAGVYALEIVSADSRGSVKVVME